MLAKGKGEGVKGGSMFTTERRYKGLPGACYSGGRGKELNGREKNKQVKGNMEDWPWRGGGIYQGKKGGEGEAAWDVITREGADRSKQTKGRSDGRGKGRKGRWKRSLSVNQRKGKVWTRGRADKAACHQAVEVEGVQQPGGGGKGKSGRRVRCVLRKVCKSWLPVPAACSINTLSATQRTNTQQHYTTSSLPIERQKATRAR